MLFQQGAVSLQLLQGLGLCIFGGQVQGVAFLPQELTAAQERTGGLFPTDNAAPLVVQLGQVAPRVDDVGEMLAEQRLRGGTHAHTLFQLFAAAHGDPSHLGCKAFYVVLFLLQQALGDEHGQIHVLMAGLFDHAVKNVLDVLPNAVGVWTKDHTAANAGIVYQLGLFHDVGVPLRKVHIHRCDGANRLFFFRHNDYLNSKI